MYQSPSRHRSVNDYANREALKAALLSKTVRNSSTSPDNESSAEKSFGVVTEEGDYATPVTNNDDPLAHDERDWIQNIVDPEEQPPQTVSLEIERLLALKSYMLLDKRGSTKESQIASLDCLTGMARRVFDVPTVLVSLVDLGRMYVLAGSVEEREIPRKGGPLRAHYPEHSRRHCY
jgi:hypothetical protein